MLDHMEDVLPHLSQLLSDHTIAVRQCLAECLEVWLLKAAHCEERNHRECGGYVPYVKCALGAPGLFSLTLWGRGIYEGAPKPPPL